MRKSVELDAAIGMMSQMEAHPRKETVSLEQAQERVLAEDMHAVFPMPPFDKSPFDGFALNAEDIPGTLPVSGSIAAGDQEVPPLVRGTAVRIFTGSPIPEGANVVVKQEKTVYTQTQVEVSFSAAPGTNIIKAGEEFETGTLLARAGEKLTPAMLGVLASQGYSELSVWRKPRVAILSTGSELARPGTPRPAYGIYNSSYYTLRGYLEKMGFEVEPPRILPDDAEGIANAVEERMDSDADLVITTGGASVGDYDYALATARKIGAEILFWKVRMKPGGALLVSQRGDKVLLGLSGNPAAAIMSILTVLQPYLRKLTGSNLRNRELELPIYQDMPKTSFGTRVLRGCFLVENEKTYFAEREGRSNGNISSFHGCSLIGVIPGGSQPVRRGQRIRVFQLPPDLG